MGDINNLTTIKNFCTLINRRTMNSKSLLFISVLLLLSNVSFSQLKNFGIKGGLNLSNAELDYTEFKIQRDNKAGFNIYLIYDFLSLNNVVISGEAGYSQKGFTLPVIITNEFGEETGSFNINNRLNYIDINAVAEFILRNSSVSPYFSIGPVLSFYTGYKVSASDGKDSLYQNYEDPLFEKLKSPVLGLITGAGVEINKVIPQTIITEVRYNFDLTNSFNNGFLNYQRNYLWQFNLGVKF